MVYFCTTLGIIPGAGDVADATLNYFLVVRKARQAEIPGWLLQKMLVNNAISAGVGFIPVVGDVVLAAFKANSRNAALLEEYLRIRYVPFILNFQFMWYFDAGFAGARSF